MSDHDSRDLEPPARADASAADYPSKDGRRAWIELTGFQRDCLEAVARRERDGKSCYPSGIAWTLEHWYPAVSRARLEPNLRALVGRGLLSKRDDQGVTYRLTDAGRALLLQRAERLAGLYERRLEPIDGVAREKTEQITDGALSGDRLDLYRPPTPGGTEPDRRPRAPAEFRSGK
ncbi:hypothetical protein [Natrinema saccharevitans]|uniref:hypothetical protein n=1 Tax=Natrinema saccharevitans TaxID=301967 RepID=UPI00096CBAD2|nr:hypothetical protein [Natrinema saccharevitans]